MDSSGWFCTDAPLSSTEEFSEKIDVSRLGNLFYIIDCVIVYGGRLDHINLHQCKRLVDFYKRAWQFFDELDRRNVFLNRRLYCSTVDVLEKGQYLVDAYSEANWLKSMETAGVNQDAFAKIHMDLEDCFRLIYEELEAGVVNYSYRDLNADEKGRQQYGVYQKFEGYTGFYPPIEFGTLAPLYFLDEDSRTTLFEEDAQKDKEHMLEMIRGSGALADKDNMFQRIESTEITIDGLKACLKRKQGARKVSVQKLEDYRKLLIKRAKEKLKTDLAREQLRKEEAVAQEKLKKEEVEKELLELKLMLQQKEFELKGLESQKNFEQEEPEHEEPEQEELDEVVQNWKEDPEDYTQEDWGEILKCFEDEDPQDSEQEELDRILQPKVDSKQEELEPKVPSHRRTELPQDFKIRSMEISILQEIASGGFATIHKCRWQNYDYAVKIFEGGDVHGLGTEVQNLVLLPRHPNIVLLVGFSIRKTDEKPMLVMELLDSDLHSLVCTNESEKKHRLTEKLSRLWKKLGEQPGLSTPIRVAIDFIYQIAKGMLFLHNKKIFHGDLKGKNVLVKKHPDDRIQLKITDFGLSEKLIVKRENFNIDMTDDLNCSAFSNHSTLGIVHKRGDGNAQVLGNVGTVRWMAPEVYGVTGGDMKPYSMKADVYSFAMTCVEILTRQHPFPDKLRFKDVMKHVKGGGRPDLSAVKHIPEALLKLVERCWDADPLHRPDFSEIYFAMEELKKQYPLN